MQWSKRSELHRTHMYCSPSYWRLMASLPGSLVAPSPSRSMLSHMLVSHFYFWYTQYLSSTLAAPTISNLIGDVFEFGGLLTIVGTNFGTLIQDVKAGLAQVLNISNSLLVCSMPVVSGEQMNVYVWTTTQFQSRSTATAQSLYVLLMASFRKSSPPPPSLLPSFPPSLPSDFPSALLHTLLTSCRCYWGISKSARPPSPSTTIDACLRTQNARVQRHHSWARHAISVSSFFYSFSFSLSFFFLCFQIDCNSFECRRWSSGNTNNQVFNLIVRNIGNSTAVNTRIPCFILCFSLLFSSFLLSPFSSSIMSFIFVFFFWLDWYRNSVHIQLWKMLHAAMEPGTPVVSVNAAIPPPASPTT